MNFDMWDALADVDRAVRSDVRDGQEARVLVVERDYDASPSELWNAVTTPERVSRWLGPVSGEFALGGRFQVEGNAGGTVLRCEEPELLEVTWEYGGEVSWVMLTLTAAHSAVPSAPPSGASTRLRLEHSAVVDQDRWNEFGPGAVGIGWELAMGGLGFHLTDPAFTPGQPDYAHPGYPVFVRDRATKWADADIAAGSDPAQATDAADRCFAAYTAMPDRTEGGGE